MDSLEDILADTQWSPTTVQLQELRDEKLPMVVRLADPGTDLGPNVDSTAPFLLYSRRRRTKVYAECLGVEKGKKTIQAYGPIYEIPKDYTGENLRWLSPASLQRKHVLERLTVKRWFEAFPASGIPPQPEANLENLVDRKQILVRTKVHVFPYQNNDIQLDEELKLYPGDVLTVDTVVQKQWKTKTSSEAESQPTTKFLKCRDFSQRDICIPLAHPGIFNPIYDPDLGTSNPENAVYQVADLVDSQFPIVVKLVFGWPPQSDGFESRPMPFTGIFQLVGLRRPDTMVLCNITQGKTLLLELPLDMDLKVSKAENVNALHNHPAYVTLLKKCYSKVYQFVISIRAMVVKYTLLEADQGRTYKRFSIPVDMDRFNPLEVFPPLEDDEQPGQSFQLSFRDPDDRSNSSLGDLRGVEEVLLDSEVAPALLSGPRTTEAVRSNLHHMRQQYNKQREDRESIA